MASVQDHAPAVKELSERRQQDPQPSQAEQPQSTQPQVPPKPRDLYDRLTTSEALRESSPPRFSQLVDHPPATSEASPPRRGPSTGTNSATLVSRPDTASNPSSGPGPATNVGGAQYPSVIQDRNQNWQSTSLAPDRRQSAYYDPIRGESAIQDQFSDDGEHDRRVPMGRVSIPRPRPVFGPLQDGNGSGNASRRGHREVSGTGWVPDPHEPRQPPGKTVEERLRPTLDAAVGERDKYKKKARQQSLLINGAIGLQVVVGAITTGVAAASKNIGAAVAVLGGISTALASYLAKARGSGEPEFSTLRSRELSTFIREVQAFIMDKGHLVGQEFDLQITLYRERFELIIKTEGEDSTSGTAYATHPRSNPPVNFHPASQQGMTGTFGGAMPPQAAGGNGQLSEKQQMWKNEKAMSGVV